VSKHAGEQLRRLLKERTASAIAEAIRSDRPAASEKIQALDRLARLVELQALAEAETHPRPWPLAALLAVTLLGVSLLLFAHVRETEIELEVNATELSFSLPSQQVLLENVSLTGLGVSGLSRIGLPDPLARDAALDGSDGGDVAIRLATVQDGPRSGSINIGDVVPMADTDVWLRRADLPNQYRLSLRNPKVPIQADVVGPVLVSLAGVAPQRVDFVSPRAFVLEPGSGVVDLDLTFRDLERAGITPQVPVRGLAFFRVDEFADRGFSIVRTLSTIVSGTLYFESLNGATRSLRAGEALQFAHAAGEIRTIRLHDDQLSLNFHGRVSGMRTGSDESARSLMPTWLEWLRARHGLSLLWGSTIYLFGMVLAVVRWFKVLV
jgi:hypothetical protein